MWHILHAVLHGIYPESTPGTIPRDKYKLTQLVFLVFVKVIISLPLLMQFTVRNWNILKVEQKKSCRDLLVIISITATYSLLSSTVFNTSMAGDQSRVISCLNAQERNREERRICSSYCLCRLDYTEKNHSRLQFSV